MMHQGTKVTPAYQPPPEPLRGRNHASDPVLAKSLVLEYHRDLSDEQSAPARKRVLEHIHFLRAAFPDLEDVKGKRVLDIACGSRTYPDNRDYVYEPWMCRLLLRLGALPVGIDLFAQKGERFRSRQRDLLEPGALAGVKSSFFDAYYVCAFPTRKAVAAMHAGSRSWPDVRTELLSHLTRCLKPDGRIIRTFTVNTETYVDGELRVLREANCSKIPETAQFNPRDMRYLADLSLDD